VTPLDRAIGLLSAPPEHQGTFNAVVRAIRNTYKAGDAAAVAVLQRWVDVTPWLEHLDAPVEPAVTRNKRLGAHKPARGGKLLYPFYPVPLVPGRGIKGEARERVVALIDALHAAMPHPALLVYLKAARERDDNYVFSMSAGQARQARGVTSKADKGDEYIRLLVDAGMIKQVLSGGMFGGTRVASTYQLLPWSPEMQAKAIAAFQAYRSRAKARPVARLRAQSGVA
jgi:hypothetical protein